MPLSAQITTLQTQKDSAADFNAFVASCSLEERVQLMQSLDGLDIKLKDGYFGTLKGLPSLTNFTTEKKGSERNKTSKTKNV